MTQLRYVLPVVLALSACNDVPREAFFNRGDPESLLDASSEMVSVNLSSGQTLEDVVEWIDKDQPTRAEIQCVNNDPACAAAEDVMKLYGVEYNVVASPENNINLFYERVVARDCENRFIDNHINPYNMSHPAFGCSTAANMVRMVTDKRQFVSPPLLEYHDAEKGVSTYEKVYLHPPAPKSMDDKKISIKDTFLGK